MKQIWPDYSYSPATNVLTLTGLNIDRDQLLLVTAADRGRIMYNFADSSVTASAFTSGANTALTLVATTAGLTTTAALVIYFDDQATSSTVTGTVELGPTSLNALESITVTMGQVTVTGGLTDVQLRASAVTVGGTVTVGNTVTIAGTVTANPTGTQTIAGTVTIGQITSLQGQNLIGSQGVFSTLRLRDSAGTYGEPSGSEINVYNLPVYGSVTLGAGTAQIGSVTASLAYSQTATTIASTAVTAIPVVLPTSGAYGGTLQGYNGSNTYINFGLQAIGNASLASATSLPVSLDSLPALPAGTNRIGVVTIGAGTVTLGAGTAQIGSVTASISGTVPVSGTFFQGTQPVSLTTLPALVAGTAQIGSVTASISNSVTIASLPAISGTVTANTFALQGTAVTTSNFTSTTASTVLANYNATREVLTIFNEGAGNLHVCVGATCTTVQYQVRLSSGDYYEAPNHQTTITHSAVFATAGTARVTEVS